MPFRVLELVSGSGLWVSHTNVERLGGKVGERFEGCWGYLTGLPA